MEPVEYAQNYMSFNRMLSSYYLRLSSAAAAECGLTKPEADVVCFLMNNPSLDTACDMAKYRGFSRAYISKALDGLVKKGFAAASEDELDRRFLHIRLTAKARKAEEKLAAMQKKYIGTLTQGMDPAAVSGLMEAVALMRKNAEDALSQL